MKVEKITKQDIRILSHIAEYRILTVKQIAALTRRSTQVIRRRLRHLSREGLVFSNERGLGHRPGRREYIVILTETGMDLLNERKILSNHADYTTNKNIDSIFIDHDLILNWFFIHLIQVGRDDPRFSIQHMTTSSHDLKDGDADNPLMMERFSIEESSEDTLIMIPDGVFTITDKESNKSLLFFLEVDRGTETLANTKRNPGDVRQKIINYKVLTHGNHYKRYEKIFKTQFNGFRLLFLANTPARMKALCDLVQGMLPSNFIWITDQERMFSRGIPADIWARGGRHDKPAESILGQKLAFESTILDKMC